MDGLVADEEQRIVLVSKIVVLVMHDAAAAAHAGAGDDNLRIRLVQDCLGIHGFGRLKQPRELERVVSA